MSSHHLLNRGSLLLDQKSSPQVYQNLYFDQSQAVEPCTGAQALFQREYVRERGLN